MSHTSEGGGGTSNVDQSVDAGCVIETTNGMSVAQRARFTITGVLRRQRRARRNTRSGTRGSQTINKMETWTARLRTV